MSAAVSLAFEYPPPAARKGLPAVLARGPVPRRPAVTSWVDELLPDPDDYGQPADRRHRISGARFTRCPAATGNAPCAATTASGRTCACPNPRCVAAHAARSDAAHARAKERNVHRLQCAPPSRTRETKTDRKHTKRRVPREVLDAALARLAKRLVRRSIDRREVLSEFLCELREPSALVAKRETADTWERRIDAAWNRAQSRVNALLRGS